MSMTETSPCRVCGTWECAACGWKRPQASRFAEFPQICGSCGSAKGRMLPRTHMRRTAESHESEYDALVKQLGEPRYPLELDLVSSAQIARHLGVTPNQVHMWHKRSHTTGFPEPRGTASHSGSATAPMFRLSEVEEWYSAYSPNANRGAHWRQKRQQKEEAAR